MSSESIHLLDLNADNVTSGGTVVKNLPAKARAEGDVGLIPWVGKIPWRRAWQPTLLFLPGDIHGQRSLGGYGPQGHQESDTMEVT